MKVQRNHYSGTITLKVDCWAYDRETAIQNAFDDFIVSGEDFEVDEIEYEDYWDEESAMESLHAD